MMAWAVRVSDTASGVQLTDDQKENNATIFAQNMSGYGWLLEAICGALGNMETESSLNPGACEIDRGIPSGGILYGGGLGVIQWTDYPAYTATKPHPLLWASQHEGKTWYDGDFQSWLLTQAENLEITSCGLSEGARWGWQESSSYPSISFNEYQKLQVTPEECAEYFFFCMEWHSFPDDGTLPLRKERARKWYDFFGGVLPPPTPGLRTRSKDYWCFKI